MALPESIEAVAVTVGPVLGNDGEPRLGFVEVEASDHATHVPTGTVLAAGPDRYDLDEDGQALVTVAASDADGVDRTRTYTFRVHLVDTKGIPVAEPIERTVTLPAATPEVALELTEPVEAGTELVAVPFVVSVAGLTGPVTAGDLAEALTPELPAPGAVDSVAGLTGDVEAASLAAAVAEDVETALDLASRYLTTVTAGDLTATDDALTAAVNWPLPPSLARLASVPRRRDLIGWDDFDRPDTTSTLGTSSCGQVWHDSSSFRVHRGSAVKVAGGSTRHTCAHFNPGRRNIRAGVWVNTPASGDFDCGFVLRSPSSGTNRMLFVAACHSTSTVRLFGRTPTADNQLASETVAFELGRRYLFEVEDLDDTIRFLVDGVAVLTYTLDDVDTYITVGETNYTEAGYYAAWFDIGLTAHHSRDNSTRFDGFHWRALSSRTVTFSRTIAHRATVAGMPENSLQSLAALPRDIYAIEVDARQTSDGEWVCMHDTTVDRTTSGTGAVADLTAAEVTRLVLDGGGGLVPHLSEVLAAAADLGITEVWVDHAGGSATQLADYLEASAIAARIVVFVDSVSTATAVRAAWPGARIAIGQVTAANVDTVVAGATSVGGVEALLLAPGDAQFLSNIAAVPVILAGGFQAGASVTNLSDTLVAAAAAGVTTVLNDYAHMINS